jgi:hypothetical protein
MLTEIWPAIEAWPLTQAIKTSSWAYPLANAAHILGLMVFFAAVAVMDVRLLGAFPETVPAPIVRIGRRIALVAFALLAVTGAAMLITDAGALFANAIFIFKLSAVGIALLNAALLETLFGQEIATSRPGEQLPAYVRTAAFASLILWITVAMLGRLIAYF